MSNERIEVTCTRCGEPKMPVVRVMKADRLTVDNYVCSSCRAAIGREYMNSHTRKNFDRLSPSRKQAVIHG